MFRCSSAETANSAPMAVREGETTEDAKGERKEKAEMMAVTTHFLPMLQFLGFALSESFSQVTC